MSQSAPPKSVSNGLFLIEVILWTAPSKQAFHKTIFGVYMKNPLKSETGTDLVLQP